MTAKPRLAVFDFACCEGCQLQLYDMEEELFDLFDLVEPVEWREVMSEQSMDFDIALIEGSITRASDELRLRQIRARTPVLVELGACASIGGVNKLKNNFTVEDVKTCVYGDAAFQPQLDTYPTRAVHELVPVEATIHGCPIDIEEFRQVIRCIAGKVRPVVPNYPVCVECKMRENPCRYEFNELCLGVITRAGCNAPCPSAGFWCFGCRGLVDDPNINAAQEIMARYGLTIDGLRQKISLFNSK